MDVYFSPLACSMATRIALNEAGGVAQFFEVDPPTKRVLADSSDYRTINGMGQVPAVRTEDGVVITENAAVLQYIADRHPRAELAPPTASMERYQLQRWLNFVATELHKQIFIPVLNADSPDGAKQYARVKSERVFNFLDRHLEGRSYLLDRFSVADCYLVTVLNWAFATKAVDLASWPHIKAYYQRLRERPSVARAIAEETPLYMAELARHKKAA